MEMEFLVEFKVSVPDGTAKSEVEDRERAEAAAAAQLVGEDHLLRVWKRPLAHGESTIVGLYRADSDEQLDAVAFNVIEVEQHPGSALPFPRAELFHCPIRE
jgi:muconolactone delta-isomerase